MSYKKITLFISLIAISVFSFVFPVSAQTAIPTTAQGYEPLESIPGLTDNINSTTPVNLNNFLNNTFSFLVAIAIVIAIVMITVGGFQYLTSAASGSKEEAKTKISNSIKGLLLILLTYIILYTINPATVSLDFLTSIQGPVISNSTPVTIGYEFEYEDLSGLLSNVVRQKAGPFPDETACISEMTNYKLETTHQFIETDPGCLRGTFPQDAETHNYSFTRLDEPEIQFLTPIRSTDPNEGEYEIRNFSDPILCEKSRQNLLNSQNRPYSIVSQCFFEDPDTGPDLSSNLLIDSTMFNILQDSVNPYIDFTVSSEEGDVFYRNWYSFILGYKDKNNNIINYRTRPYTTLQGCQNAISSLRNRVHQTYYTFILPQCVTDSVTGGGDSFTTQLKNVNTDQSVQIVFPTDRECSEFQNNMLDRKINKYNVIGTCQKVSS